jgi:uncharacterized caspase-like protein
MKHHARSFLKYSLLGLALASFASEAQSPQDVRIALVIGNAAYKHVPALANSGNDAKSMASLLGRLGFKVLEVVDGDRASMHRAIEQMRGQLSGQQAVAMLYYAGHGLQLDWRNYMVPVDAKLGKADDVPRQTVDIQEVIRVFKSAGTRMNIIVLDACRDNPFPSTPSSKGLAPLDAPPGTFLAFATAPGNVAEDGDAASGNGLFTEFLIKELQKPTSIENVFKRVRLQVRQKSQGRQIPWDSSSLEEEFAFNDGAKYTINSDDLAREAKEAKEKQERLKAEAEAAKQREIELARQREQERVRLAEEQKRREIEAEERRKREVEIAKQIELERKRLAEAEKIKEQLARQKAETESKERERLLALAAEEQTRLAREAERARIKAETEARERERQLALAVEAEKKRAQEAAQALERTRLVEAQRLKDIELAKAQAELEAQLKKESAEKQFEIQKVDWDKIKDSKNVKDFYAFLLKYPTGYITEQATFAIEQLEKAKAVSQPDKNGQIQKLGEPRFRIGDKWVSATRDSNTDKVIVRREFKIDKIEDGLAYFSSQSSNSIRTLDGAVLRAVAPEDTYTYDPPLVVMPGGEINVGMKWAASTLQTSLKYNYKGVRTEEFRVVAHEQITVPAGVFWTYKIERTAITAFGNKATNIQWFSPDFGIAIKTLRKTEPVKRFGITLGSALDEVTELVSLTRGNP